MPPVEYRKRNSILGSIALLLAPPALALNYFDFAGLPKVMVGPFEMPFAIAAAAGVTVLAVVSVLLAGKSRRTGTEIPVAATLIGAAALGVGYFHHRTTTPAASPAPSAVAAPAETKERSVPATMKFGVPSDTRRASLPNASNVASQAKSLADTTTDTVRRQRNLAALREAQSRFDGARAAVLKTLETDPAYAAVKSDSDAADAELKRARAAYPPGNSTLVTISEAALAARDRLQQIISASVEKDPAAREAQDQLRTAQAAMKTSTGIK